MHIRMYTLAYNEEKILPYLLRHYSTFCDSIVVYDDGSTDRTREIAASFPKVELRDMVGGGSVDDTLWRTFWSTVYKEARGIADFVMLVDADEFLYHPHMRGILGQYKEHGINFATIKGYNMVSPAPPSGSGQIYDEIRQGYQYPPESKQVVFDPLLDVEYEVGRHQVRSISPQACVVKSPDANIVLLHYAQMGVDYIYARHSSYVPRMSELNKLNGWGSFVYGTRQDAQNEYDLGVSQIVAIPELQTSV